MTVSKEHYIPAFDVRAFNYIVKRETTLERFEEIFLKAVAAVREKEQEFIIFSAGGQHRSVPINAIRYFEVSGRIITVYYEDKSFEFFSSIGKIENQLIGRGFIRVHRSFLAAVSFIEVAEREELTLRDGTKVPVGRKYSKSLKETITQREVI